LPDGIIFGGKAASGKTTWAELVCEVNPDFERWSFAEPVKRYAGEIFGIDFFDPAQKAKHRRILQRFGTEVARSIDPDVWINHLIRRWEKAGRPLIAIDDCRFPNEIMRLQEAGDFVTVRLDASDDERRRRAQAAGLTLPADHSSETALDTWEGWDFRFHTDGISIDEARRMVVRLLEDCGFPPSPNRAKAMVYLSGGIFNLTARQAQGWRNRAKRLLGPVFYCIDPTVDEPDDVKELVRRDLSAVLRSDALLVNLTQIHDVRAGTVSELFFAKMLGKPTYVYVPPGYDNPWVTWLSTYLAHSLEECVEKIKEDLLRPTKPQKSIRLLNDFPSLGELISSPRI